MATRNSAERGRSEIIHLAKRAILAQIKQTAQKNINKRLNNILYNMVYEISSTFIK